MRVHELAKELGVSSKEILSSLEELGVGGRTASSSVPEEALPRLRATGGKAKPGVKVKRAAVEPAPKPRKKPEAPADAPAAAEPAPTPEGNGQVVELAPAPPEAPPAAEPTPAPAALPVLKLARGATPQDVAERTERPVGDVVKALIG